MGVGVTGAMVVRATAWSQQFLAAWFEHPTVRQGAPDQYVFDRLWEADTLHVRRHTAVLPVRHPGGVV
jgi:hypothetical protein